MALLVSKKNILALFSLFVFLPLFAHANSTTKNTKQDEPIEIDADTLEVFQEKNQAIFTGNVRAIQGNTRLSADKMIVFYKSKEEKKSAATTIPSDPEIGGGSSIERIEVEGNVFLATPKETAQGKRGNYEISSNMIYLYDSVVLTSGENTIRGDELAHNRKTSRSKISSNNQAEKKHRVKSVFVPESSSKNQSKQ
jgi:lipopolysaccharide export system protein LptA